LYSVLWFVAEFEWLHSIALFGYVNIDFLISEGAGGHLINILSIG